MWRVTLKQKVEGDSHTECEGWLSKKIKNRKFQKIKKIFYDAYDANKWYMSMI